MDRRIFLAGFAVASVPVCATVAQTSGPKGGRPGKEYGLNEEQALLVAALWWDQVEKTIDGEVVRNALGIEGQEKA